MRTLNLAERLMMGNSETAVYYPLNVKSSYAGYEVYSEIAGGSTVGYVDLQPVTSLTFEGGAEPYTFQWYNREDNVFYPDETKDYGEIQQTNDRVSSVLFENVGMNEYRSTNVQGRVLDGNSSDYGDRKEVWGITFFDHSTTSAFTVSNGSVGGVVWDGSHFWVASSTRIYKYTSSGSYTGTSWPRPHNKGSILDIAWDGNTIWVSYISYPNWDGDTGIYSLSPSSGYTGTKIVRSSKPDTFYDHIVWDGSHLWARTDSYIYQIDRTSGFTGVSVGDIGVDSANFPENRGLYYFDNGFWIQVNNGGFRNGFLCEVEIGNNSVEFTGRRLFANPKGDPTDWRFFRTPDGVAQFGTDAYIAIGTTVRKFELGEVSNT